ncbi:MAG: hypothetical protein MUO99_06525 [Dehalococcoidales bacterium]|nr:hypothetical protein [Dehalococcoidales bacterium]
MVLPKLLLSAGIIILIISLGMALGLIPALAESIRDILPASFGSVGGVVLILYGIWKVAPDEAKRFVAEGLRKIPNLPIYYKRRTVKFELESEINTALKEFGKEGAGFVEHEVVINWLTPNQEARSLFFRGGKAYLKLDFTEDKERNLVEAVLMYCNECLLPDVRQYIARPLMRAIDLIFIDEMLDRRNAVRGRAYFTQEIIPRETEVTPDINKYLDTLELISQHGLFIRILLPEIRDYPGRTHRRVARQSHLEQIETFIEFLRITAEDRTNMIKRAWLHIGETIRIGIVLVGVTNKLQFEGTRPYVRRTAMHNVDGARNVYLIGYNLGVMYVPRIAKEAKQRGIVEKYEIYPYDALIGGELKKQVLARLSIPEGAGKQFLELFPNQEEWPDLEDEADTGIVLRKDSSIKQTPAKEASLTETPIIESPVPEKWELDIDDAWSKRANKSGESIHGSVAAADAARVLGASKLTESPYKTLRSLLDVSEYLQTKWSRNENTIVRH